MTLAVNSTKAETKHGVPLDIQSVCQIKVKAEVQDDADGNGGQLQVNHEAIRKAAQNWLGLDPMEMQNAIRQTMEGHQRQIMGTLTVEELYKDRATFVTRIEELVTRDLDTMGFRLVSYVITRIADDEGYMRALGATQTATVKGEADAGKKEQDNMAKKKIATSDADMVAHVAEQKTSADVKERKCAEGVVTAEKNLNLCKQSANKDIGLKESEYKVLLDKARAVAEQVMPIQTAREKQILVMEVEKQETEKKKIEVETEVEVAKFKMTQMQGEENAKLEAEKIRKDTVNVKAEAEATASAIMVTKAADAKAVAATSEAKAVTEKVRNTPSWPRIWANFKLLSLYSHRNVWANLRLLGQPNTLLAKRRTLKPRPRKRWAMPTQPRRRPLG
jgi:flotillin